MILVDSSVWIDFFRGVSTPQSDRLDQFLGKQPLAIGDLILVEVLQGFATERDVDQALDILGALARIQIADTSIAIVAARNFRRLRALGVTPRKTIDTLIATRCIVDDLVLLHDDRDFEPFERHLGLKSAMSVGSH